MYSVVTPETTLIMLIKVWGNYGSQNKPIQTKRKGEEEHKEDFGSWRADVW